MLSCTCHNKTRAFVFNARSRRMRLTDPTQTTTLRRKFEADLVGRFKKLKQRIREVIVAKDGFKLKANVVVPFRSDRLANFDFERTADKVAAFMNWLRAAQNEGILEISRGTPIEMAARNAWSNVYITSAYQKGLAQAAANLEGAGYEDFGDRWLNSAFFRPIHADRAGLAYTRTFTGLDGITQTMDTQISRVLAEGLSEGLSPLDIAGNIVDRVDSIGITRARLLARTEVISAHAEASLNAYEEAGLEGVAVRAEWSTAGDDQVCPECEDMEGKEFDIEEARGMIPLHPNCRCAFIPIVDPPAEQSSPSSDVKSPDDLADYTGDDARQAMVDAGYIKDNFLPQAKALTFEELAASPFNFSAPSVVREATVSSLKTVQDYLVPDQLQNYLLPKAQQPFGLNTGPIFVIRIGNEQIVIDGTHRLAAAVIKGLKTIEVRDYGLYEKIAGQLVKVPE